MRVDFTGSFQSRKLFKGNIDELNQEIYEDLGYFWMIVLEVNSPNDKVKKLLQDENNL